MPKDTTKLFDCKVCDKTFDRSSDYDRHLRTHTGDRPHACTWPGCEKAFSQSSGLKTHMNTHTKSQPHACKEEGCYARFSDPSSCSRHEREIHKPIGTYECPFEGCHSAIKRRSAFTHHLQEKHQHTHLEPAQIDACNPILRNGAVPVPTQVRRNRSNTSRTRSGRRSSRAKASRRLQSPSPVFFRRTQGIEQPAKIELPSTLAVPIIPDSPYSIPSTSSTPLPYGYGMGSPYTASNVVQSSSSSPVMYNTQTSYNHLQRQPVHFVPHDAAPSSTQFMQHQRWDSNGYLTVPHTYASSSCTQSVMGSPALTHAATSVASSSPSASPSPAPEMMGLYPTVQHATPEPQSQPLFGVEQANIEDQGHGMFEGVKHDEEMQMFLFSVEHDSDQWN